MNFINYLKENKEKVLIPITALLTFLTWYFNVPEIANIILYLVILAGLILFKFSNITILMFTLFTTMANRTPLTTTSSGRPATILYLIIYGSFLLYFVISSIIKKKYPKGKLVVPLLFLLLYALLSLIWTVDLVGGLSEISYILLGYMAYFVIRNETDKKISFYDVSWFLSLVLLVLSLQFFTISYKNFPQDSKWILVNGLWGYINAIATIFGLAFVPSLYKYFAKDKSKYRFLYLPLELLVLYSIIVSGSEGLYVALAVSVIVIIVMLFVKNRKILFTMVVSGILLFAASMLTVVLLKDTFPDFYNKLDKFYSSSRIDLYRLAFIQLKNPLVLLFGRGAGSTHKLLEGHYLFYYYHSWFFQITVQRGLISFAAMIYVFYLISKILAKDKSQFKFFVAVGLITYLVHTLIDIGFEYQYLGVFFYLMVGLVENNNDQEELLSFDDEKEVLNFDSQIELDIA